MLSSFGIRTFSRFGLLFRQEKSGSPGQARFSFPVRCFSVSVFPAALEERRVGVDGFAGVTERPARIRPRAAAVRRKRDAVRFNGKNGIPEDNNLQVHLLLLQTTFLFTKSLQEVSVHGLKHVAQIKT
jgi:hypothetical protein